MHFLMVSDVTLELWQRGEFFSCYCQLNTFIGDNPDCFPGLEILGGKRFPAYTVENDLTCAVLEIFNDRYPVANIILETRFFLLPVFAVAFKPTR